MSEDTNNPAKPRTERDFIHDIATPVSVALGQVESALDEGRVSGTLSDSQKTRLEKALKALNKVRDLMITRRNEIGTPKP